MKKAVFVLLAVLFTALQIAITWRFQLGWHNYELLLCSVIILSLFDVKTGVISAILCGFLLDCIQSRVLGLHVILLLLVAAFVFLLSKVVNRRSVLTVLVLVFTITFLAELVQYWIFFIIKGVGSTSFALTKLIIPQALINMVCAVPIYFLIRFLWKKLRIQKERWEY